MTQAQNASPAQQAEAFYQKGVAAEKAGDPATARDSYSQALKLNPELRTVIAASAAASHGSVMHVVDTVRDAGAVKIAFAADKVPSSAAK